MKKSLTLFTTILLASCAAKKEFYTVCPIKAPNAWKKAPDGGLRYRQLAKGVYGCNKATCAVPMQDWKTVLENMAKCEHARQGLVDLMDALNTPMTPELGPKIDFSGTDDGLPEEFDNVPIVDPRSK